MNNGSARVNCSGANRTRYNRSTRVKSTATVLVCAMLKLQEVVTLRHQFDRAKVYANICMHINEPNSFRLHFAHAQRSAESVYIWPEKTSIVWVTLPSLPGVERGGGVGCVSSPSEYIKIHTILPFKRAFIFYSTHYVPHKMYYCVNPSSGATGGTEQRKCGKIVYLCSFALQCVALRQRHQAFALKI